MKYRVELKARLPLLGVKVMKTDHFDDDKTMAELEEICDNLNAKYQENQLTTAFFCEVIPE